MLTIKMLSISTLVLSIGLITGSPASGKGEKADSASVSRRLAAAKSLALILEADAADLTSFAKGKKDWSGQVQMERRISADMSKAKETARELQEMQDIASPGQVAVIRRVTPLVGDLIANTRLTIQHLTADPGEAHSSSCIEYVMAHEEIAKHLASLIVEAIEQPNNPGEGARDPERGRLKFRLA